MMARGLWTALVCSLCASSIALGQSLTDPSLKVEIYATPDVNFATGMRWLPSGDIFIIEKDSGKVKHLHQGTTTTVLDLNVANASEQGLVGIELSPTFEQDGNVFLYYSAAEADDGSAWTGNKLSRFHWDGTSLSGETNLLTIAKRDGEIIDGAHNGGPIKFGPDGMLYGTTGDLNRNGGAEANLEWLADTSANTGGIYRLDPNGNVPVDNPFVSASNPDFHLWYSYGVRNSFGIAFDPVTGKLWDTENGPEVFDEINLVEPGLNSGWLQLMGPADPLNPPTLVELPGSFYSDPEFSFRLPLGITSIEFLANSILSDYLNYVIVGDSNNQALYALPLNEARDGFALTGNLADLVANSVSERNQIKFGEDLGAVTDLTIGPDGALYTLAFYAGTIYRISPVPEAGSLSLLASAGVLGLGALAWRKRSSR